MEKDELNDLLREVCRDEILKDARPTLTTLKALHADRPLLVLALSQAIDAITELTATTVREARLVEALDLAIEEIPRKVWGDTAKGKGIGGQMMTSEGEMEYANRLHELARSLTKALAEYRGEK